MTQKRAYGIFFIALLIVISIAIMIIPSFATQNVSRHTLNKKIDLPLIASNNKDVNIVFFGYSGCAKICTPRLMELAKFYETFSKEKKERIGVEFIDISSPKEKELPENFATSFNKNFQGIYLNQEILRDYTKAFSVYFSPSLMNNGEFEHTANLYLVKKTGEKKEIRYMYNAHPYDFKQINSDIEELLNE